METKLQIISGKYRGKKLRIPESARPTQNRARLAIFNILQSYLTADGQYIIWDSFAGSGAMGLEFISRFGASRAIFTDIDPLSIKAIKVNTENIKDCEIEVMQKNALDLRISPENLQLFVFIDPPYSTPELGQELVDKLGKTTPDGTIIVWETENLGKTTQIGSKFTIIREAIYGRAKFLILYKK